ncbi:MAG: hypothetical protein M3Q03_15570, partial [Chloroflexota bacterium]|nr:hypothetical protein [Chloroflexota bacterium]
PRFSRNENRPISGAESSIAPAGLPSGRIRIVDQTSYTALASRAALSALSGQLLTGFHRLHRESYRSF